LAGIHPTNSGFLNRVLPEGVWMNVFLYSRLQSSKECSVVLAGFLAFLHVSMPMVMAEKQKWQSKMITSHA
jgi:hypothetical protein